MGTGVVSIGLLQDGHASLSAVLLVACGAAWAGLALLAAVLALRLPRELLGLARSPAALTAVAGTAVFGARVAAAGRIRPAEALLAVAVVLWLLLAPAVLGHWQVPTVGASFLLAVSTESLAALAALLARVEHSAWLAVAAVVLVGAGVAAYVFVLARFDLRQLVMGRGDHWVAGGALAIAALACGHAAGAVAALPALAPAEGALRAAALALWVAAALWLPVLLACELAVRRGVGDLDRWSTLFPVGMYAGCSFVVGGLLHARALVDFARVWIWVAFALWLAVAGMLAARGARSLSRAGGTTGAGRVGAAAAATRPPRSPRARPR